MNNEQETIVLGIVGIKNMGVYNALTTYEKLNVVTYQGSTYCALKETAGNLPTNPAYWQLYAEKGDTGDTGATGQQGPKPVKGVDYYTSGDIAAIEDDLSDFISDTVSDSVGSLVSATPLAASSTAEMSDTTRIYVNTTDGHWYWYDGAAWQDGGVYQATQSPEVEDGRIAYGGKTYTSIGNAIRGQVENVYEDISTALDGGGIETKNYLNGKFVMGSVHGAVIPPIDQPAESTNTAFYQEYLDASIVDKVYFDDTIYKALYVRYDENYEGVSFQPSWITRSPMYIYSEGNPYIVVEFRRKDGADFTVDALENVVYYTTRIENKLIDDETFSEYTQEEVNLDFELSEGYYVGQSAPVGADWKDNLIENNNSIYLENSLDLSDYVGETLKISVNAVSDTGVRRFGFCNSSDIVSSSFTEIASSSWKYDETENRYIQEFTITDTNFFFSFSKTVGVTPVNVKLSIIIDNLKKKVLGYLQDSLDLPYYVSENGSDESTGLSQSTAFATVTHALEVGATNIFISGGVYEQTIDLTKTKKPVIKITKVNDNEIVLFKDPARSQITNEELVDGYTKVYKAEYSGNIDPTYNRWIFQEGVPEGLISNEERHPLQRGREYRLDDTKIQSCSASSLSNALTEIENSNNYRWFLDSTNHYLYFSRPQSVSSSNPICIAKANKLFKTNTEVEQSLIVTGINTKYLIFNLENKADVLVTDCKAENVCGGGAFVYDRCLNGKFVRCEAARAFSGPNGDGFNGHSNNTGNIYSKQTTVQLIECWSHDNNDDGYSDHERSEINIFGGLYEYNGKGGITPSYGSHCTCHDVYSRKNYAGFYYTGAVDPAEGGKYGQMVCYNCVAENNTTGGTKSGFRVNGTGNKMELVNCKSIGNYIGYAASANSNIARLIDCSTLNDTNIKYGTGQFEIINTIPVTQ